MKKSRLILSFIALFLTLAVMITMIYAWYINVERVTDMGFKILQIDSLVTTYEANDDNFNGVPNKLTSEHIDKYHNNETEIPYSFPYYHENYSFNYLDQKLALSFDSEANLFNTISIAEAVPSKIYCYKFEIINYSGRENTVTFSFDDATGIDLATLKKFEVRMGYINSTGKVLYYGWKDLCGSEAISFTEVLLNDDETIIPAQSTIYQPTEQNPDATVSGFGRLDLWLQIRIKKEEEYFSLTSFRLPQYRIKLESEVIE